jgi:peptidoglycan/LPS O-acetylase OafA/YrhL
MLLLPSFDTNYLDPPTWSLVYEMRLSLVFPILVAIVLSRRAWIFIGLSLALEAVLAAILPRYGQWFWDASYWVTFGFVPFFLGGIWLARHSDRLKAIWQRAPFPMKFGAIALAFVAMTFQYWFQTKHNLIHAVLDDPLILAGTAVLVVGALNSSGAGRLLRTRPLQFLGEISYSLYLLHFVVLLVVVHLLYPRVEGPGLIISVITVSIGLAFLVHRAVERPGIVAGRRLATHLEGLLAQRQ